MGPAPNATASLPRRQSCNRCYGQKLRCTRSDNRETGACDRCLRKGALCAYSSSLPKGRPSLYRTNEVPVGSKATGTNLNATTTPPATAPIVPESPAVATGLPSAPVTSARPDQQCEDIAPASESEPNADADADQDGDVDMNPHDGAFVLPASMAFADSWASWWPDDTTGDNMLGMIPNPAFHLDPSLEGQSIRPLEFRGAFPSDTSGVSMKNSGCAGQSQTRKDGFGLENDLTENTSINGNSSNGQVTFTTDNDGFKLNITHLSHLSTRLSQLLCSSRCFLADSLDPSRESTNQDTAQQVQLGIKGVFDSLNAWLLHGSPNTKASFGFDLGPTNAFGLLHHVFSSSNHLVEILRHIRVARAPDPSTTAYLSPPASNHSSVSQVETAEMKHSGDRDQDSFLVVHHLVLVCMTLLLNMYVAILVALQRSANALNSPPRARARNSVEPNDHMDAASRVHLQLVSVVQMCSYFIKRQNRALDMILSSSQGGLHAPSSQEHDARQSVSSDAMSDLKTEVEQRLRRLQESLSIIT
ncbi:hypothetical protein DL767_000445 [Monosporascus sp. MG133]|nr:hypothetical protein DL767_000445 [Monosporascus sp. MG133]